LHSNEKEPPYHRSPFLPSPMSINESKERKQHAELTYERERELECEKDSERERERERLRERV
jgi:hypothetical protein